MGQTLTTTAIPDAIPPTKSWTWPVPSPTPLPIHVSSSPHNTVVLDIGRLPSVMGEEGQACMWHLQGGLRRYPVPEGYRARCTVYGGIGATLLVEYVAAGHGDERTVRFIMHTDEGTTFSGATPTAPFAKLALSLNRLDVVNGMDAFGFNDTKVQALLRHVGLPTGYVDTPPIQCLPDAAASPWAYQPGEALEESTIPSSIKPEILLGMKTFRDKQQGISNVATEAARDAATRRTPSLTPSLQTWLPPSASKGASLPAASPKSPPGMEVPAMDHGGTGTSTAARMPRSSVPPGSSFPASTRWKEPVLTALAVEGSVEPSGLRPPSRTRRRPPSAMGEVKGGRGWTAFTAYGMETREIVRQENPWATATEVEKLVGRRWAALPPEEKQRYVDMAAEVRRSSQGMYGPVAVESAMMAGGEGNAAGRGEGGGEGGVVEDQRQLRQVRRPKSFGPEFDTSDANFARNTANEPNSVQNHKENGEDEDFGAKRRRRGELFKL